MMVLAGTLPALAALPPQYQRQAELRAIVDTAEVVDAFGFDAIDTIEEIGTDLWHVRSGACVLEVRIEDLPNPHGEGWVGPREFEVVVGEKACQ
ncbi:hypothetical protein [Devosia sp. SL43]|uniref:hypothetical protein n=1 Tax=Devosia sp. SL43 TaxID=2806348 RepID=UPI001F2D1A23|nr:hypothetical protein [Devosia sp. SL43]UJW84455.1 hypothetical protein IM737_13580 [Devosia sp. SL43]